jgi:hypothetical protein
MLIFLTKPMANIVKAHTTSGLVIAERRTPRRRASRSPNAADHERCKRIEKNYEIEVSMGKR